jgi:S1-C subfamily serine protease
MFMKFIYSFIFCLITVFCNQSFAETNFNQSAGKFLGSSLTGSNKSISNSYSLDQIASDDLPLNKLFVTANSLQPDVASNARGVKDAALFSNVSPSVVLILSKDGTGSGSIIGTQGQILTNWHVVGNNSEVGVILKPPKDVDRISKADIRRAKVLKIDQVSDLALIQLVDIPVGRAPIRLGDVSDIGVGIDVHAIGHPNGEAWTYTKGIVSQYRNDYQWTAGPLKHKASVIQTQTPINPGNSGGPLLTDNGVLVGVNSFVDRSAQGINFAVSIEDVKQFLARGGNRLAEKTQQTQASKKCEMREVFKGKLEDGSGEVILWDSKCSGKGDLNIVIPYDKSKPIYSQMDRNHDGKVDVMIFSENRDYKWDFSFWDENFDTKWDLFGFHRNGEVKPYKFEDFEVVRRQAAKR